MKDEEMNQPELVFGKNNVIELLRSDTPVEKVYLQATLKMWAINR